MQHAWTEQAGKESATRLHRAYRLAVMLGQGIAALMALNSLELEEGLADMGWGSAAHLHAAIESMRLAFADALAYNADPEVESV